MLHISSLKAVKRKKHQVSVDQALGVFPFVPLPVLLYQVSILKQQAAHRWEEEKKSPAPHKYYSGFLGSISLMSMELLT